MMDVQVEIGYEIGGGGETLLAVELGGLPSGLSAADLDLQVVERGGRAHLALAAEGRGEPFMVPLPGGVASGQAPSNGRAARGAPDSEVVRAKFKKKESKLYVWLPCAPGDRDEDDGASSSSEEDKDEKDSGAAPAPAALAGATSVAAKTPQGQGGGGGGGGGAGALAGRGLAGGAALPGEEDPAVLAAAERLAATKLMAAGLMEAGSEDWLSLFFQEWPVTLRTAPERGRHIIAAKDLNAGELVFESQPYSYVVADKYSATHCHHCFKEAPPPSHHEVVCATCGSAHYCSQGCQHEARGMHAGECAVISQLKEMGQDRLVAATRGLRMFIRLLYLRAAHPESFRQVDALEAHWEGVAEGQRAQWRQMANGVNRFVPPGVRMDAEELAVVISKVHTNLHGISDVRGRALGPALYPLASFFNHSCDPNCVVSFRGTQLCVRMLVPVKAGEELCIAYTELYCSRAVRREELMRKKHFTCECPRCMAPDPPGTGGNLLSGWLCQERGCNGVAGGDVGAGGEGPAPCPKCGAAVPRALVAKLPGWQMMYNQGLAAYQEGNLAQALMILERVLEETHGALHEHHSMRFDATSAMVDAAHEAEKFDACDDLAGKCIDMMEAHYPRFHPAIANMYSKRADAVLNRANKKGRRTGADLLARAKQHLQRAAVLLMVPYGRDHPAVQAHEEKLAFVDGLVKGK